MMTRTGPRRMTTTLRGSASRLPWASARTGPALTGFPVTSSPSVSWRAAAWRRSSGRTGRAVWRGCEPVAAHAAPLRSPAEADLRQCGRFVLAPDACGHDLVISAAHPEEPERLIRSGIGARSLSAETVAAGATRAVSRVSSSVVGVSRKGDGLGHRARPLMTTGAGGTPRSTTSRKAAWTACSPPSGTQLRIWTICRLEPRRFCRRLIAISYAGMGSVSRAA